MDACVECVYVMYECVNIYLLCKYLYGYMVAYCTSVLGKGGSVFLMFVVCA